MSRTRDVTIDVLRGLAVFTMIPANMSALVYAEPHDFWFRLAGSFAAPLFVLLSGYMVAANTAAKERTLGYYALRGLLILAVAVLIDLMWGVIPFMTFDVLYVIGLATPLIWLFRRVPGVAVRWGIAALCLAAGPLLQHLLGYGAYPTEVYFDPENQVDLPEAEAALLAGLQEGGAVGFSIWWAFRTSVLHNLLVDGWFPLFPWLGLSFLGALLADLRAETGGRRTFGRFGLVTGLGLLAVGAALWVWMPGALHVREGYSELFYPPTPGFLVTSVGLIVVLFELTERVRESLAFQPLRWLGEASLFMYGAHLALINYVLAGQFPEQPLGMFLLVNAGATAALLLVGFGLRRLKEVWRSQPMLVRFLLGG
jgi:uncharacterized membrane protein